jgi:hypothetical protein
VKRSLFPITIILIFLTSSIFLSSFSCVDNAKKEKTGDSLENQSAVDYSKYEKPVILFDLAHREVFSPSDPGPRGLKSCATALKRLGFEVVENTSPFSRSTLKGAAAVFIAGAMQPLGEGEIKSLTEFVKSGGSLIITVHVSYFLQPLLSALGYQITSSPLCDAANRFHENNKDFLAKELVRHPLTENVTGIAVMGAYGLKGKNDSVSELIFTSPSAWVDMNGNDIKDTGDIEGKFCVVAASEFGKGKIVIIGDDAVFSNLLIQNSGNSQLLKNIFEWFIGKRGEGSI